MPKYRYYITNTLDGFIVGTNDEAVAKSYAESDEFFVVDTETNQWFLSDGSQEEVEEAH